LVGIYRNPIVVFRLDKIAIHLVLETRFEL